MIVCGRTRTMFCHLKKQNGAVFPVQRLLAVPGRSDPRATAQPTGRGRNSGLPPTRADLARVVTLVFDRRFGEPVVDLAFQEVLNAGVIGDEGSEVFGLYHQGPDHADRRHSSRTRIGSLRGAFADQLTRVTYGQD